MRSLHVAAMPFPSPQGTQALVRSMLTALAQAGHDATLATYAGLPDPEPPAFAVERARRLPGRPSLRSGPSVRKLVEDVLLARLVRRAARARGGAVVVAHHVEAALAVCCARTARSLLVLHTALDAELPTYAPRLPARLVARAGATLDARLASAFERVAAVSPALAARAAERSGRDVHYLPAPWPLAGARPGDARTLARRALGLDPERPTLLYAGNLDGYQGWEDVLRAAARLTRGPGGPVTVLLATQSCATPVLRLAGELGLSRTLRVAPLATDADREAAHDAADLAVIPRRHDGGVSVKLLEALSRGTPVVCTARAASGLGLDRAACVVRNDDPDALATGARALLEAGAARRSLADAGRAYIAAHHAPSRFVDGFDAILSDLLAPRRGRADSGAAELHDPARTQRSRS